MKVRNKTHWDTIKLKKLLTECIQRYEKYEGEMPKWKKENLIVEVGYGHYSGQALLNGSWIRIRVPKLAVNLSAIKIAKLFLHELYHVGGYMHSQMGHNLISDKDVEWAAVYPLPQKEKKKKPKEDLQLKRYNHVLKMLEEKQKQLKRLQNQIKKWARKKRYYERVLIAAGKIKK